MSQTSITTQLFNDWRKPTPEELELVRRETTVPPGAIVWVYTQEYNGHSYLKYSVTAFGYSKQKTETNL